MAKSHSNFLVDKKTFDKSFSVVIDENGSTSIIFGNSEKGARLPSVGGTVDTSYNRGSGEAGNVPYEKPKGVELFSTRAKAIEFLGGKIVSELKTTLPEKQGQYIVYLDVWQRHMTSADDPLIRETALREADTSAMANKRPKRQKKEP